MQPFISWSSRTSGPSTCSLSAALLSTTAPTPIIPAAALDVGPNSKLFRRFGDFYKRFYSTVSEDGKSAAFTHDKRNICGSGSISGSTGGSFYSPPGTESKPRSSSFSQGGVRPGLIRHCRQTPDGIHQDIATNRKFKPPTLGLRFPSGKPRDGFRPYKRRELGPVPPKPSGEDWEESSKSPIPSFRYPSMITLREESVAIGRALAYTLPESSRPPDSVEASVHQLVKRLEDHDRLVRALEWEIGRRHYLIQAAPSEEEETGHLEELQSLQKIYTHISRFYYDETGGEMAMRAVEASRNSVASGPFPSRAYIPPFPHYRTFDPPVALNKSLLNLFHPIAPPPKYLLKISYNLLTSPSPPDLKSYNIMIRGFTLFRQSSLAHMVLHSVTEREMVLDDYSIVALINLCVKSGDYDSYRKVLRTMRRPSNKGDLTERVVTARPYGKLVLEAVANAAAKFLNEQRVNMALRKLKRQFPDSPGLSLFMLTSLMKLYTYKWDWIQGIRAWTQLKELDKIAHEKGEEPVTDMRAYRQMLLLCRTCRKPVWFKVVEKEIFARGWDTFQVLGPSEKTKGMHYTSEVKVPRLAEISNMYERHTWRMKRTAEDVRNRTNFMEVLGEASESRFVAPKTRSSRTAAARVVVPPSVRVEDAILEDMDEVDIDVDIGDEILDDDPPKNMSGPEALDSLVPPALRVDRTAVVRQPKPPVPKVDFSVHAHPLSKLGNANQVRSRIWKDIMDQRLEIARAGELSPMPPPPMDLGDFDDYGMPSIGPWQPALKAYIRGHE